VLRVFVLIRLTRFCRRRLLGRNLITVFSTVNTLTQLFSPHRRAALGCEPASEAGRACLDRRVDPACKRSPREKHRKKSTFVRTIGMRPALARVREPDASSPSHAFAVRISPLATACCQFRFFASHKAKCAELRKKYRVDVGANRRCADRFRALQHHFEHPDGGIGIDQALLPIMQIEERRGVRDAPVERVTSGVARVDSG
jgi:hypothetical protein